MTSASKSTFRYDINALRAFAVIAVVLFHFKVPFMNGGFVGVDIFFVISGYLMSKIVINGLADDNFSILDFYHKRGMRIVPALLFLVLTIMLITFFIYLPTDFHEVVKNGLSSILFYSNMLYSTSNYFDAASENNIFLHTWSLSVEWQFYLILPLLLWVFNLIFKNKKERFLILFIIAALVSFAGSTYITKIRPIDSFYFLPTRSWEMLLGGIAFLLDGKVNKYVNKYTALVGYTTIFVCLFIFNDQLPWPGYFTSIPVFGTFLIILSNQNSFFLLYKKVVVFIGNISYSLYLWHWPIIVIGTYLGFKSEGAVIIIYLIFSFAVAGFSYYFIERSILLSNKRYVILSTALISLLTGLFTFFSLNLNEIVFKKETIEIANYNDNHVEERKLQFNMASCFLSTNDSNSERFDKTKCLQILPNVKNFILMGDSHAAHLSQSLREALANKNINLMQASSSGCNPIIQSKGEQRCSDIINYMFDDFIPKHKDKIDGLIISSYWSFSTDQDKLTQNLKKTIAYIEKLGIPIVIIGQNETYNIPSIRCCFK
jgi:peptidoglycan/LPS O-acetylase OafA/YrhL